jgi:hypothetical protein
MNGWESRNRFETLRKILIVTLVLFLLPFLFVACIVVLVTWLIYSLVLYVLVWLIWRKRGKDILFVYSNSPIWQDYIEEQILPKIESRSVVLNWSHRREWLRQWSLASLVFRNFGGQREFNPLAIYFPLFAPHRSFRFWRAFRNWKHGNPEKLNQMEEDLFRCIGCPVSVDED